MRKRPHRAGYSAHCLRDDPAAANRRSCSLLLAAQSERVDARAERSGALPQRRQRAARFRVWAKASLTSRAISAAWLMRPCRGRLLLGVAERRCCSSPRRARSGRPIASTAQSPDESSGLTLAMRPVLLAQGRSARLGRKLGSRSRSDALDFRFPQPRLRSRRGARTYFGAGDCSSSSVAIARRWRSVSDPIDLSSRTATCARNARERASPQPR